MSLAEITELAAGQSLDVFGAFHPADLDGVQTLVLLGPREPGFWAFFTGSEEYRDGAAHPLDRWSERVITEMATRLHATAIFPFGGPPYQPFIRWAQESGRAHVSPVGLLVHDRAGLWVSYRGALGFRDRLELPTPPPNPCLSCEARPCLRACPVDAFAGDGYDVAACKADLDRTGNDCMAQGCAVRRACPVSRSYGRQPEQSTFHMEAFR